MRIDGSTCTHTHVDEDTGNIVLRRLHPRIASYNDVVMFLLQSNMDIKFIGSGEGAKALLYYVTDYITKPSLPTHVGLGALSYAIQKTNDKVGNGSERSSQIDVALQDAHARGALTMTVNRMLSRQEISHQQVMSYLVGGGDAYRSHTFRILHWGSFDRIFSAHDSGVALGSGEGIAQNEIVDEVFTLRMGAGTISSANQRQDYIFRPRDPPFDAMCLYEFVGTVEKVTNGSDQRHGASTYNVTDTSAISVLGTLAPSGVQRCRGRTAEARGLFASDEHTQFHTHHLRKRSEWTVPVILGDRIPRSDRGDDERERWARMMLILFIPWRIPADLRISGESWIDTYERRKGEISPAYLKVIANMNVLSECRDVRDAHRDMRRAEALAFLQSGLPVVDAHRHTGIDGDDMNQDFELFDKPDVYDAYDNVEELQLTQMALDASIGPKAREMVDACFASDCVLHDVVAEGIRQCSDVDDRSLSDHGAVMRRLKRDRRPRAHDDNDGQDDSPQLRKRRRVPRPERISRATLPVSESSPLDSDIVEQQSSSSDDLVEQVIVDMGLTDNVEQTRAFRIVAEHILYGGDEQLLMYIAGVGGTGKSHVVRAIVQFLSLLDR
ncbi:hypothetical protein FKP32DRAFT_1547312, partial [Trametes sanguinea]